MTLTQGTRIYNKGDMANPDHFGTITAVRDDKRGLHYEITPDDEADRERPYWIDAVMFSPVYLGHGGTRFVTEAAYQEYRAARIAEMQARMRP